MAAFWHCLATESALIFLFKFIRAGSFGETDFSLPLAPEINTHIAMAINILDHEAIMAVAAVVAQTDLHHKPSHSFFGAVGASKASKASSSNTLSHTIRPSICFGLGIRPSLTISSNFVPPPPTYSAA